MIDLNKPIEELHVPFTEEEKEALIFLATEKYGREFLLENRHNIHLGYTVIDGELFRMLFLIGETHEESKELVGMRSLLHRKPRQDSE